MKKIILSLLAIAFFVSCGDKNTYTITGTIEGVADGSEVFMYEDGRGKELLETVVIKDGKFTFSGVQEESVTRFIEVAGLGMRPLLVIAEPGEINISQDGKVTGSPLNDKNTEFLKYTAEMGSPDSDGFKFISEFIKENADNALGVYYFTNSVYYFDLEELKEIMALIPDKFKESADVKAVIENINKQEATAVGAKFTNVKGLTPEGKEIALSDYAGKGKLVLVDFWASWCPPCVRDMPHLVTAYTKYKGKGFEIVGISLDKTNEDWSKGIKELNITWPQMSDLGYWDSELSRAYAVSSIPYTVLIDGEGTIVAKGIGGAELDSKLEELLGK